MQKYNRHCPEQAKSEAGLQNRLRSVVLRSYRSPKRNGDCPESKRVHRSTFIKVWYIPAQAQLKILSFHKQSCLLVAHIHRLFDLCAMMHLFQVKNCVKLVAQETKTLLNTQGTGMKHVETFVLEQGYKQLYQWIQSKQ